MSIASSRVSEERCGDGVLQADFGAAPGLDIRPVGTLAHQRVVTDGRVDAVINQGVMGTDAVFKIVDCWTLRDGRAGPPVGP